MTPEEAVLPNPRLSAGGLDVEKLRADFPILRQKIYGKELVYLDNAASSQKPMAVIDKEREVFSTYYSNIHRGVHWLSERSTRAYEDARIRAQRFVNAREAREIIFVRGTTEAVNLVAQTFGRRRIGAGDEILITAMEHHSNIVPWQMLCEEKGAVLKVAPINGAGEIVLEEFEKLLSKKTRIVSVAHISNALGTVNPVRKIIELSHSLGVPVFVDGAQAAPHLSINVRELDCDFYAFSAHKMYGPNGVGVLYGKASHLEAMPPYQGGGDMISSVTFEKTTYNVIPHKFEAGTPNIAGVIGFGAAVDYVEAIGLARIAAYEAEILRDATEKILTVPGVRIIGTAREKASVLSFVMDDIHPHDIGTVLDQEGIAVRTGHHCAQPVMDWFGIPATVRASFSFYNTKGEIDALVAGLRKVHEVFG
jgi:cysteine desulfurase/selenocysteine lyase